MSGLSAAYFEVPVVRQPHHCLITNIRQRILHSVDSGEAWGGSPKILFKDRLPKIPVIQAAVRLPILCYAFKGCRNSCRVMTWTTVYHYCKTGQPIPLPKNRSSAAVYAPVYAAQFYIQLKRLPKHYFWTTYDAAQNYGVR